LKKSTKILRFEKSLRLHKSKSFFLKVKKSI